MSSGSQREQPTGVIRQGNRVVGCIVMPEADDVFIREFNHCYGQLRLSVASTPNPAPKTIDPNTFQLPTWFRHVWHSVHPESTEKPSTEKPSTEKPSTEKPSTGKPSTELNSPVGSPPVGLPPVGIPTNKNGTDPQTPPNPLPAPTAKPSKSSRNIDSKRDAGEISKPTRREPSGPPPQNEDS